MSNYRTPLDQLKINVKQHSDKVWLHQPVDRQWHTYTWLEADTAARKVAKGLLDAGLVAGDKVSIIAKNSAEWYICDLAIMMAGLISVPIYPTASADNIKYVIEHSGVKAMFIGKLDDSKELCQALPDSLITIAMPSAKVDCQLDWHAWLSKLEPLAEVNTPALSDTFSIIYTSGSTGLAKGVLLSYLNVASSAISGSEIFFQSEATRVMSYLPLAHITERCVVELPSIYNPAEVFFTESIDTFIDDVKYARPTAFLSVPRLWTKFQSKILAKMPNNRLQLLLKIPFVGQLVARKIRENLGLQECVLFGSGSAPISPEVLLWFHKIGISIGEGWGMTESSGLSCSNVPFDFNHLGTIGTPQPCVEMKLSAEGEVLIKGDAVFSTYYNNEEATQAAFEDGWFKTGDKAELKADGSWKIIGRVKEQFKTSKGKYVSPVPIESSLGRNPDIEQVCVIGVGRKQPIALIVLGEGTHGHTSQVRKELKETLIAVNQELEAHEKLDHLIVVEEPWSIENGLLTPTLKLKRDQIEQRYHHLLSLNLPYKVVLESKIKEVDEHSKPVYAKRVSVGA
ncbi:AMP-dependent synthetase [Vibrio navarrensis]|uniref:AMP-binding protein n=1 Tax=Vibrio navarrensis TaxID=29495 RepID=UPI00052B5B24|nr:AMP-binding protein [Vibrio navarrensis]KGK21603.1 AMP-dependent synthetase [Vibrio navarrensis]